MSATVGCIAQDKGKRDSQNISLKSKCLLAQSEKISCVSGSLRFGGRWDIRKCILMKQNLRVKNEVTMQNGWLYIVLVRFYPKKVPKMEINLDFSLGDMRATSILQEAERERKLWACGEW